MEDDSASPVSPPAQASGRDSFTGPALRRAATVNFGSQPHPPHVNSGSNAFGGIKRRGSTFSDGFSDARRDLETSADELFNPTRARRRESHDRSALSYTPLVLALLPAVAGMFFQNGAAFFTDLILLCIAAVILNWSVTQPWDWYFAAQEIRIANDEPLDEPVFESDSDFELSTVASATTALEDVPEESSAAVEGKQNGTHARAAASTSATPTKPASERTLQAVRRDAAAKELFIHEMAALVWCFLFPLIATYILHTIRNQLTRPSEGLISDYNLTIFLCAAEFRPIKHMLKMVHDRTLRVQRVVAASEQQQERSAVPQQIQELLERIDDLEAHAAATTAATEAHSLPVQNGSANRGEPNRELTQAAVAREINKTMVPELEALNRAMRRYEKKLALLASQTDNRLEYIDFRLQDAIALAAIAAKNSKTTVPGFWSRMLEKSFNLAVLPFHAAMAVLTFPFRTVSTVFMRKGISGANNGGRRSRQAQGRGSGGDRVPSRLSRR